MTIHNVFPLAYMRCEVLNAHDDEQQSARQGA